MTKKFCRPKFSQIGHWQRFCERLMISKPCLLLGVHITTPASHVQLESAVMMASEFCVEVMVFRCHIYKGIWDATVSEELPCQTEPDINFFL